MEESRKNKKFRRFKFQSTANPNPEIIRIIPTDKKEAEFEIALFFRLYLLNEKRSIDKIESNLHDENKKPDILTRINGEQKGIQITKLLFNDLETRKQVAEKKSFELIELLNEKIKIDFKLNINIHPPKLYQNFIPKKNKKLYNLLIEEIIILIEKNKERLTKDSTFITEIIKNSRLNEIALSITLFSNSKDLYSPFIGKNNINVNYEFDNVFFDTKEMEDEIDTIYKRKNNGFAEILIIWANQDDLLHQEKLIVNCMKDKFKTTSFEEVYFMFFYDRQDLFKNEIGIERIK